MKRVTFATTCTKLETATTQQYLGAVHTLNEMLAKMPPLFNATQKIEDQELLNILASKAPQSHKAIMIEHGFDPQTATVCPTCMNESTSAKFDPTLEQTGRRQHDTSMT
jgi:hypothetical protein